MSYLAVGDSISIDKYTEVPGGGAVSQFAKLIGAAEVQNLTEDGNRTHEVLASLDQVTIKPDIITVTVGGNDLIESGFFTASLPEEILQRISRVYRLLSQYQANVIVNTVYDPTDGDDSRAADMGLDPNARLLLNSLNDGIKGLAKENGFLCCDLEALFQGHGFWSAEPWIVKHIEPNLAGATAIANAWMAALNG